ncbi:MAG: LPXTG cell wall anchor domain-containing protein [Candidatus Pacearchaeota archaeon]
MGYTDFSFGVFRNLDYSVLMWACFFLICFAFINYVLSKFFKDSKFTSAVISAASSILIIYYVPQKIDLEGFFYDIGIHNLAAIIPWVFIILSILIIWRKGLGLYMMIIGVLIALAGLIGLTAQNGWFLTIGIILFILGLLLYLKRKKKLNWKWSKNPKEAKPEKEIERKKERIEKEKKEVIEEEKAERIKREQRQRTYGELKRKYNEYSNYIREIQKRTHGKIPPRGTKEGEMRHRCIQAMQAIENLARKQGFDPKTF